MDAQVYKKKGRRYYPIGYSDGWKGFPTDGIWVVQTINGSYSSECMMKIDELENMRPALDLILGYKDKIVNYMAENNKVFLNGISYNDFVMDMLKEITREKKGENKF